MARHCYPQVIPGGRATARPHAARALKRPGAGLVARLRLTALGGVFAGLLFAFWPAGSEGTARAITSDEVQVIDGDTFWHAGERVRIAGIDTPELNGRCAREIELAGRARRRLRELLAAGPFEISPAGDRDVDRFGRRLRDVTRDGRSLGDTLVAEGLARPWVGWRRPWCAGA